MRLVIISFIEVVEPLSILDPEEACSKDRFDHVKSTGRILQQVGNVMLETRGNDTNLSGVGEEAGDNVGVTVTEEQSSGSIELQGKAVTSEIPMDTRCCPDGLEKVVRCNQTPNELHRLPQKGIKTVADHT